MKAVIVHWKDGDRTRKCISTHDSVKEAREELKYIGDCIDDDNIEIKYGVPFLHGEPLVTKNDIDYDTSNWRIMVKSDLILYHNMSHDSWQKAYFNDEVYEWLEFEAQN